METEKFPIVNINKIRNIFWIYSFLLIKFENRKSMKIPDNINKISGSK